MISQVWNINKKGHINLIQNSVLLLKRRIFAILFSYCHHFVLKIIVSKWLLLSHKLIYLKPYPEVLS